MLLPPTRCTVSACAVPASNPTTTATTPRLVCFTRLPPTTTDLFWSQQSACPWEPRFANRRGGINASRSGAFTTGVSFMGTLTASDGHQFAYYRAQAAGQARGAVLVIPEIFGVNAHIRSVCD